MSRVLYHLLLKPLSHLPLPILYVLSDMMFLLLYYLAGFRKKVVLTNLRNAFPDRSPVEISTITRQFYRHLCDLIVESIRMFSMPAEEAIRRCRCRNPEILEPFYRQGRSVIIPSGHYNNWEMAAYIIGRQISHQTVALYSPLRNRFFNDVILKSRSRFGLQMIPIERARSAFAERRSRPTAVLMASDQSPTARNVHWTRFLNQDTAVLLGTEKYAAAYDQPVVFGYIYKMKRGYYEIEFAVVEDHPIAAEPGSITEKHTRMLEAEILENPAYWLWSHKRWKRKKL